MKTKLGKKLSQRYINLAIFNKGFVIKGDLFAVICYVDFWDAFCNLGIAHYVSHNKACYHKAHNQNHNADKRYTYYDDIRKQYSKILRRQPRPARREFLR